MNYRTATVLAEKELSGEGTEVIPILLKDIVSRLFFTWRIKASKHGMDSYPHSDITKIELVDGSDVLFGMDGGQCQALCIYDRKVPTMNYGQHMEGLSQVAGFSIDFGRFLFDPVLAFDPKQFDNPTLKISYDSGVADEGVEAGNLEVRAEVFDEKLVSPVGFLMSKEHHSRTPPASGYWYVALPTDRPIRKMLIQGFLAAFEPWNQVSEARIDEDNEKRIPFDLQLETYQRLMQAVWTPVEEVMIGQTVEAGLDYFVTPSDYWTSVALMARSGSQYPIATAIRGGKIILKSSSESCPFSGVARGYLPNHCFEFPFGDQMDIADWYDVAKLGSLRLRMAAGDAEDNGVVSVVLQQLRRYGA